MTATMAHLSATADDTTLSVVDNDVDHYSTPAMATVTASNSASMSADDDDDSDDTTPNNEGDTRPIYFLLSYWCYFDVLQ